MEFDLSLSLLLSVGGIIASVASSMAIVKTKVAAMEEVVDGQDKRIEAMRENLTRYQSDENVKIALLQSNQEAHAKELAELKSDIKVIMNNVQEIKEAVLKVKKGEA